MERKIVQSTIFPGQRHDDRILKFQILLSRDFVVIAQARTCVMNVLSVGVQENQGFAHASMTPRCRRP